MQSPKPKIWLGELPPPKPKRPAAPAPEPEPAPGPVAQFAVHQVVLASASAVFRQQLHASSSGEGLPTAIVRLRSRDALPAAELLLHHVYGKPLDWAAASAAPATLVHLGVLARDHALPALEQACVTRLMHLLASKRPSGPPGPSIAAAAAAPGSPYLPALAASLSLVPPDVAAGGAFCSLSVAARALLADVFAELDAAWALAPLRALFLGLPLAEAVALLGADHLTTGSEVGVLLAALSYDVSRLAAGAALSTAERIALYATVRWHHLQVDGRAHERVSFVRNAITRLPYLLPLLEHGMPGAGGAAAAAAAAAAGGSVPPHPLAVPELLAAAAAAGPYQPASSLLDLSQLAQTLARTRQQRLGPPPPGASMLPYMAARAPPRPRPAVTPPVHLAIDLPYSVIREAVARVTARLAAAAGPNAARTAAVEEDIVAPTLAYGSGYWWQLVVSVGPLCRYRLALAGLTAAAAVAAAAAHEHDARICCFVGVRPLLLLTEPELAGAAGRTVPTTTSTTGSTTGASVNPGGAAAAAATTPSKRQGLSQGLPAPPSPLIPGSVYVDTLTVWNERDELEGRASLGPTCFSGASGFRGTTTLFELGPVLAEEGYWAKVLGRSGQLSLRARVAGVQA